MNRDIGIYDAGRIAHRLNLHFADNHTFFAVIADHDAHAAKIIEELKRLKIFNASKEDVAKYIALLSEKEHEAKKYTPYIAYGYIVVALTDPGFAHLQTDILGVMDVCPHLDRGHYNSFISMLAEHRPVAVAS